jgi:hypothetical protein
MAGGAARTTFQVTEPYECDGRVYPSQAARETLSDGREWIVTPVWTPAAISRGLQGWCERRLSGPRRWRMSRRPARRLLTDRAVHQPQPAPPLLWRRMLDLRQRQVGRPAQCR